MVAADWTNPPRRPTLALRAAHLPSFAALPAMTLATLLLFALASGITIATRQAPPYCWP